MNKVGSFLGDWWRLVVPYFRSEEWPIALVPADRCRRAHLHRRRAWKSCSTTGTGRFYDSLQNKDEAVFWREIITFSWLAAFFILNYVARAIVSPYLRLRWRRWLTAHYSRALARRPRLLPHRAAAHGRQRRPAHRRGPAAARRIHHDAVPRRPRRDRDADLVHLHPVATSRPAIARSSIGLDVTIPGYMAWVALLYAFLGTFLANLVGRRLISTSTS
jgi:putative ATP-binding cassette transporter